LPARVRRQAVGKNAGRPELAACLDYLRPGDTLVVPSLDRLSRLLVDLIAIVGTLRRRGVGFKSLHEAGHHHPRRPTGLPRLRQQSHFSRFSCVPIEQAAEDGPRSLAGSRLGMVLPPFSHPR
jgi:Resolvase, N terminal domain